MYSPRSISSRHSARASLESQLDKWHIELPESLRLDTGVEVSPPHILTLHMQYWCAVLLLHRPLYVLFRLACSTWIDAVISAFDRSVPLRIRGQAPCLGDLPCLHDDLDSDHDFFLSSSDSSPDSNEESRKEARATTARCNELCAGAANHITSIGQFLMPSSPTWN